MKIKRIPNKLESFWEIKQIIKEKTQEDAKTFSDYIRLFKKIILWDFLSTKEKKRLVEYGKKLVTEYDRKYGVR